MITTALAFVLWFGAVQQLGAARAGLLVGLMPVAAVAVDAALNGRTPSPADIAGTALVAVGARRRRRGLGAAALRRRYEPVVGIHNAVQRNVGRRSDDARPRDTHSS